MPDPIVPSSPAPDLAAPAASSPTVAQPSQGPAPVATPQASAPSPSVAEPAAFSPETPAAPSDAPAPAPVAEPAPEPPKPAESLLSKAPEPKAPEADTTAPEVKADAPEAPTEPAPLPTYEPLVLPEGVKLDEARIGAFDKLLGEHQNATKADQAAMQGLRQQLADFYIDELRQITERHQTAQAESWNRTRESWKDEFRNDPEIGGNRQDTTLKQAAAVIDRYGAVVGQEHAKALRAVFSMTGAGDNPAVIRFVNWASSLATERSRPIAASVPKSPNPTSRSARRYAGSNGAA